MSHINHQKIVLAGEGGQGVQLVGELLAETAYISNLESIYIPNFGVEQRGGVSIAFVQISQTPIGAPKFQKADLLVVLSPRSVERTKGYIKNDTFYLYDSSQIKTPGISDQAIGIQGYETVAPEGFSAMTGTEPGPAISPEKTGFSKPLGIPAAEIAKAELNPRVFNIIILGAIVGLLKSLNPEKVMDAIRRKLGGKFKEKPELEELNLRAFHKGMQLLQQYQ
ncbi:MAG TPA: 2-oxoacid:acceptor oxidoreductase family protein [Bacillota bacterium]|nr:2-oxoacid:acceptor oxidoreductase family protein [Bacillota bacterium]